MSHLPATLSCVGCGEQAPYLASLSDLDEGLAVEIRFVCSSCGAARFTKNVEHELSRPGRLPALPGGLVDSALELLAAQHLRQCLQRH